MWGAARRLTLRQRLVAIVAVAILPVAAAFPYFIASIHHEREREVRDLALRTSEIASLEMERIITGAQSVLETLAYSPAVGQFQSPACDGYLAEITRRLPQLRGLAIAAPDGEVRCTSGIFLGPEDLGSEDWFASALRDNRFVVGEYVGARPDEPAFLPIALPLGENGRVTAIIVSGIDLDWLGARLRERDLAKGSALAVADRNGVLIAREPDPERFVGTRIPDQYLSLVHADKPGTVELTSQDGTRRILGYQPAAASASGLYVSAGVSTAAAFGPIYASTWRSIGIAAAGALLSCAIAWYVGDRLFRRPLRRMIATIASWRAGDETARTHMPANGNELAALGASIDDYMDSLLAVRAQRAAADEHRMLVMHEMNHRIKNVLAAVQAIANQTFKHKAPPESLQAFGGRLAAMAAAQDLLVSENWKSVDLDDALTAALAPFERADQRRFNLDGPPLRVASRASMSLSMAVHELCTNAAKYGALSVPGGSVAIEWHLAADPETGTTRFRLTWVERNGPPVTPPQHQGFGSQLIRAALAGELAGTARLDFEPAGVCFRLDADAARVLADPSELSTTPIGVPAVRRSA